MKHIILSLLISLISTLGNAQTATDFTANDCNGNSHNLFTELDAGKVIVLCWVMPCGACTGTALTANNIVQSYMSSNPNSVFLYLCDDYGNSNCSVINAWGNSNGIPQSSTSVRFSNSAIDMNDYGSTGMPKVVVLGGASHTVFYNANNTVNATSLQNAINSALISTGLEVTPSDITGLNASPNPSKNSSEIKFNLGVESSVNLEFLNLEGKLLKTIYSGKLSGGENKIQLDVADYSAGMYLIKLSSGNDVRLLTLMVSH